MSGLRSMGQRGKLSPRKLEMHEASAEECSFITVRGTQVLNLSLMACESHKPRLLQCSHRWETPSTHMCNCFARLFIFLPINMRQSVRHTPPLFAAITTIIAVIAATGIVVINHTPVFIHPQQGIIRRPYL
jgi:hypothetical protein